jgi:hypothetical protein
MKQKVPRATVFIVWALHVSFSVFQFFSFSVFQFFSFLRKQKTKKRKRENVKTSIIAAPPFEIQIRGLPGSSKDCLIHTVCVKTFLGPIFHWYTYQKRSKLVVARIFEKKKFQNFEEKKIKTGPDSRCCSCTPCRVLVFNDYQQAKQLSIGAVEASCLHFSAPRPL